jgi:hypothetical protein
MRALLCCIIIVIGLALSGCGQSTADNSSAAGFSRAVDSDASNAPGTKAKLTYNLGESNGLTLAVFDGWASETETTNEAVVITTCPTGRQSDYMMQVMTVHAAAAQMTELFTVMPVQLEKTIPALKRRSEPRSATFNGDQAVVLDYDADGTGEMAGKKLQGRAVVVRKKGMALVVLGLGTHAGFEEFGRSIEIVVESATVKDAGLEPGLVGSWLNAGSKSVGSGAGIVSVSWRTTLSIFPDGSFTESDQSMGGTSGGDLASEGGQRGSIVQRGNNLTLRYANGTVTNSSYEVDGDTLQFGGKRWRRLR